MRARIDGQAEPSRGHLNWPKPASEPSREPPAVVELFSAVFKRDLLAFFPRMVFEVLVENPAISPPPGVAVPLEVGGAAGQAATVRLFGRGYRLSHRDRVLSEQDLQMVAAVAAVLSQRYEYLFSALTPSRLELYRGGAEDHYVAAFIDPEPYVPGSPRTSRIAATLQILRTAALSTYENRRVSTGALLLGKVSFPGADPLEAPADAIEYGIDLTSIHSIHRLCDGRRTLFLIDQQGRLADVVDVARWAKRGQGETGAALPQDPLCSRAYQAHAEATRHGGNVCLVLSPNQEIKLFAEGRQAFVFSLGRWRILDPARWYAEWVQAVRDEAMARTIFQAALDMAEDRQGGLFVIVQDLDAAVGPLIAQHDLVDQTVPEFEAGQENGVGFLTGDSPLIRRAVHYLARGRKVTELDPPVLEALASLDGALVMDTHGQILAFGAILRHHTAPERLGLDRAEGARTTAALVASLYGPVLKVSEDGIVSFFLNGVRVWDL